MAIDLVNVGATANDGTGDTLRDAYIKLNASVTDLVTRTGPATALGSVSGPLAVDPAGARAASVTATLTGNVTIAPANVPGGVLAIYTVMVKQDATGSRTVTYPVGTTHLNGGDGSIDPTGNSVSIITLVTADGGTTWFASVADSRPTIADPLMFNPAANGTHHVVVDRACTLLLGAVTKRGTGTLAFAKALSATPTTFNTVTGSTAFAAGDVLRVTITAYSGYLAFNIPRA